MKNASISLQKITSTIAVALLLVAIGSSAAYLQTAFGWTNPTGAPPTGSGALTASGGNIGINYTNPTSTLAVNGNADFLGNTILNLRTPTASSSVATKGYVDAALGGGGGDSLILYYRTDSGNPTPAPSCPTDYSELFTGYGPHYLGVLNYDWYSSGSGGSGGGFPAGGTSSPPPAPGSTYYLSSVAFGSDSACSQNASSTIPVATIYLNSLSYDQTEFQANACSSASGNTTCNRCKVCVR